MSRYGFNDIFAGRGLLGSLYSPDMETVVPLADKQATNQPDKYFSGPTPADVEAAVGESQPIQAPRGRIRYRGPR